MLQDARPPTDNVRSVPLDYGTPTGAYPQHYRDAYASPQAAYTPDFAPPVYPHSSAQHYAPEYYAPPQEQQFYASPAAHQQGYYPPPVQHRYRRGSGLQPHENNDDAYGGM